MADKKISQLTALSAANLAPSTDVLAIVDTSATETKKIAAQDIVNGVLNVASAVGIGTASPTEKLTVAGNIKLGTSGTSYLYGPATSGRSFIANSDTTAYIGIYGSAYGAGSNSIISFVAGTTNTMTFDASGNLGLGVTPSAWTSSVRAIETPTGAFYSYASGTTSNFYMLTNAYFNGTNNIYKTSNFATQYLQSAGQHIWSTAPSGTAGNAITGANAFVQAMTLDASGNLMVGTTSATGRFNVVDSSSSSRTMFYAYNSGSGDAAIRVGNVQNSSTAEFGKQGASSYGATSAGDSFIYTASSNWSIMADGASSIIKFTTGGNTERARITAGGYFKASNSGTYAGSASAYHELYSNASSDWIGYFTQATATSPNGIVIQYTAAAPNGTGNTFLYCQDNAVVRATIRSNGGIANYSANDVNLSDERTKKDIAPLGSMWDKFKAIEIVTFKYKDQTHEDNNIGVIAQQVESVAPEFVDADGFGETPEDGVPLKTVYTTDMYHAAIKALQEAMARIEQLEADMAALKASA